MEFKIIHSSLAEKTFNQNITYLKEDWTIKEIRNFIIKTSEVVELLKKDPFLFPKWEFNENIRKVVLLKQISMFYTIDKNTIQIHLFWNNYKDPKNLIEMLKY